MMASLEDSTMAASRECSSSGAELLRHVAQNGRENFMPGNLHPGNGGFKGKHLAVGAQAA